MNRYTLTLTMDLEEELQEGQMATAKAFLGSFARDEGLPAGRVVDVTFVRSEASQMPGDAIENALNQTRGLSEMRSSDSSRAAIDLMFPVRAGECPQHGRFGPVCVGCVEARVRRETIEECKATLRAKANATAQLGGEDGPTGALWLDRAANTLSISSPFTSKTTEKK